MHAARSAIARAFGRSPALIREGGSIPVVGTFQQVLGVDTLLLGWGQNTDNLHSPNERFSLEAFHQGTRASAALWALLAERPTAATRG
jgi:acetylornithine deacetylase/succinyl-diaminopimelate desuccinylase-like protein